MIFVTLAINTWRIISWFDCTRDVDQRGGTNAEMQTKPSNGLLQQHERDVVGDGMF